VAISRENAVLRRQIWQFEPEHLAGLSLDISQKQLLSVDFLGGSSH
jgi:hypothetical protein